MIQPRSDIVELPGRSVVCRELTLSEIRNWLITYADPVTDVLDNFFILEDCRVSDLLVLTDLKKDELEGLTPSQMGTLLAKAKEVNPRFFLMRETMEKAVQKILSDHSNSQSVP